jgi:glycerol kinase
MNTGENLIKSEHGLITTLAAGLDELPQYVLEGSVFVAGALIQWIRDELKLIESAKDTEEMALKVDSTDGLYIIPAFVGLGAPYWESNVRGIISGITRGTKKEHIVRAALEAIAYQVHDIIRAMENDLGEKVETLSVDGGACVNDFLMQFQADINKSNVLRPKVIEVTARGAAYLAGLKVKYWDNIEELKKNSEIDRIFEPSMDEIKRKGLIKAWDETLNMLFRK